MSDDKPEPAATGGYEPAGAGSGGGVGAMFWWGIAAGFLITGILFFKPLLGLARDAFVNVLPLLFSPGVVEVTLGIGGFCLVILINYWLLRKEARDEWVILPDDDE